MDYHHQKTMMVTAKQCYRLCYEILRCIGLSDKDAAYGADSLNESDIRGTETHGIARIHMYSDMAVGGRVNVKAQMKVLMETDSLLYLDADHGMGIVMAPQAMDMTIAKAKKSGICATAIKNSGHCGLTGYYTYMAAKEGLFAFDVSSGGGTMVPFGGADKVLGNSPFSMAFPGTEKYPFPIMFDIATSLVAGGKLEYAVRNGQKEVPLGWLVDSDGLDTHDPLKYYGGQASLLPMAAHKGYILTVLLEVLSTIVTGSSNSVQDIHTTFSDQPGPPENVGHFYIVIDPTRFRTEEELENSLNIYLDAIKNSRTKKGSTSPILLPGELEANFRAVRENDPFELNYAVGEECLAAAVKHGYVPDGTTVEELFAKVTD